MVDIQKVLSGARDAMTVKRVYGDPYEKDGVTINPAAAIGGGGGGGGGEGTGPEGQGHGSGSGVGFGLGARPVGAYVIKDGNVTWEPAVDVTRLASGALVVAGIGLFTLRKVAKRRRRR